MPAGTTEAYRRAEGWSSSDEKIATVDNDGTVTAVAHGAATISYTVTVSDGTTYTTSCNVTVISQVGIESINAAKGQSEFFTLQGIRIEADKLVPGVYIRRTNGCTDKIFVK